MYRKAKCLSSETRKTLKYGTYTGDIPNCRFPDCRVHLADTQIADFS